MKKYNYRCDGGSLQIGNADCLMDIPNGYGDGVFEVFVLDDNERIKRGVHYVTCIRGRNIKVYDYDCLKIEELEEHVLFELSGKFGVYADNGNIYIERW